MYFRLLWESTTASARLPPTLTHNVSLCASISLMTSSVDFRQPLLPPTRRMRSCGLVRSVLLMQVIYQSAIVSSAVSYCVRNAPAQTPPQFWAIQASHLA